MIFGLKSSRSTRKIKRNFGKSKRSKLANFLGNFGVFKKKEYEKSNLARSNSKVYYNSQKSNEPSTPANFKVFKPSQSALIADKLRNTFIPTSQKKFSFGWKQSHYFSRSNGISIIQSTIYSLKLEVIKWKILERFNRLMIILLVFASTGFVIYLSFFDTYFLVKTYSVDFDEGSFLDQTEVDKIIQNINIQKQFNIFPNNQYWFLNEESITKIAQETVSEVNKVTLVEKNWPSRVELKIETKPILLTLITNENNQKRYWRIGQKGQVVSEDTLGLRENLVSVDRSISFDKPGVNLKNYAIEENQQQVNRFWFVVWLWKQLGDLKIQITNTSLPSIMDSDVEIQTLSGTRLLFSSDSFTSDNQKKRIDSIFYSPSIANREKQGQLAYIDFRIPKKVFVCEKNKVCEK